MTKTIKGFSFFPSWEGVEEHYAPLAEYYNQYPNGVKPVGYKDYRYRGKWRMKYYDEGGTCVAVREWQGVTQEWVFVARKGKE